jgi:hypothetical protein
VQRLLRQFFGSNSECVEHILSWHEDCFSTAQTRPRGVNNQYFIEERTMNRLFTVPFLLVALIFGAVTLTGCDVEVDTNDGPIEDAVEEATDD